MAVFIALGLVSAVSAMMWIGPRVTVTMGEDLRAFSWLARAQPARHSGPRDARAIRDRESADPGHDFPKSG